MGKKSMLYLDFFFFFGFASSENGLIEPKHKVCVFWHDRNGKASSHLFIHLANIHGGFSLYLAMSEALGSRDKSNSSHLPGTRNPAEQSSNWADNDDIAHVLNKCGLADLRFEDTEWISEEYPKDHVFTKGGYSNSNGIERKSGTHERSLQALPQACPIPSLKNSFPPRLGCPSLVSKMNAGLRPELSEL